MIITEISTEKHIISKIIIIIIIMVWYIHKGKYLPVTTTTTKTGDMDDGGEDGADVIGTSVTVSMVQFTILVVVVVVAMVVVVVVEEWRRP